MLQMKIMNNQEPLKMRINLPSIPSGGGTSDYEELNNKPKINGVTLIGNKTTEDLHLKYDDTEIKQDIEDLRIELDNLDVNKQNKLIAGDNIAIENNVISAIGGGISIDDVKEITGELENLETEDKTDLVSAINEVANSSGGGDAGIYCVINNATEMSNENNQNIIKNWFDNYINGKILSLAINTIVRDDSWESQTFIIERIHNAKGFGRLMLIMIGGGSNSSVFDFQGFQMTLTIYYNTSTNEFTRADFGYDNGYAKINKYNLLRAYNDSTLEQKVLTTDNAASYTPTANYNPATKKYVDDSIANAITTTLGGIY